VPRRRLQQPPLLHAVHPAAIWIAAGMSDRPSTALSPRIDVLPMLPLLEEKFWSKHANSQQPPKHYATEVNGALARPL
jgi:hypothetical protein